MVICGVVCLIAGLAMFVAVVYPLGPIGDLAVERECPTFVCG